MSKLKSYELHFNRHALPTVQHKAGLGGLAFLLRYLEGKEHAPAFSISRDELSVTLSPTELARVFEELYRNIVVVRTTQNKPQGDYWEETVDLGEGKTKKVFKYRDTRPAGRWLFEGLKPGAEEAIVDGTDDWHKLWQDSLWQTFRGIPATRKVFDTEAGKKKLVDEFWKAFEKNESGKPVTLDIASTIYVGAQAQSPEGIGFEGTPDEVFLLHFTQVLAQPYKVVGVNSMGDTYWPGVIWVFPSPRNLKFFVSDCKVFLGGKKLQDPDFRGRSRVTLPQEAALGMLSDDALGLSLREAGQIGIDGALCTHLNKEGNNINLYASTFLPSEQKLINQYKSIVAEVKSYPLRKLCLENLLKGKPLYSGVSKLLSYLPKEAAIPVSRLGYTISRDCKSLIERS